MTRKAEAMRVSREASAGRLIDDYPLRLDAHHLAEVLGVSLSRLYQLDKAGDLLRFQNVPTIGVRTWSRERVKAYLDGTLGKRERR